MKQHTRWSLLLALAIGPLGTGCAGLGATVKAAPVLAKEQPSMELSLVRLRYVEKAANLCEFYLKQAPIGANSAWPASLASITESDASRYYDELHCKGAHATAGRFVLPMTVYTEKFEDVKGQVSESPQPGEHPSFFDALVALTGDVGQRIKAKQAEWAGTVAQIAELEGKITALETTNDTEGTSDRQIERNKAEIDRHEEQIDQLEETADLQFDDLTLLIEELGTRSDLIATNEKQALARNLHAVAYNVSSLQAQSAVMVLVALTQFARAAPSAPDELKLLATRWAEETALTGASGFIDGMIDGRESGGAAGAVKEGLQRASSNMLDELKTKAKQLLDDALGVPARIGQLGTVLGKSETFSRKVHEALGQMLGDVPLFELPDFDPMTSQFSRRPSSCHSVSIRNALIAVGVPEEVVNKATEVAAGIQDGSQVTVQEVLQQSGAAPDVAGAWGPAAESMMKERGLWPGQILAAAGAVRAAAMAVADTVEAAGAGGEAVAIAEPEPEPEPPACTGTGALLIKTEPSGAEVELDGNVQGSLTPISLEPVDCGTHHLVVRKGDAAGSAYVDIVADEVSRVTVQINAFTGKVRVSTTPPEATVLLDGKEAGITPLIAKGISFGEHEIRVSMPGFATHVERFTVESEEGARLKLTLNAARTAPTPRAVAVAPTPSTMSPDDRAKDDSGPVATRPVAASPTISQPITPARPAPPPTPPPPPPRPRKKKKNGFFKWGPWAALGLTVAAAGAAGAAGGLAARDANAMDSERQNSRKWLDLKDSGERSAMAANVMIGFAGAAAVTTLVLFLVDGSSKGARASVVPLHEGGAIGAVSVELR